MKMKKKILASLLAVCLFVGMAVPAFAVTEGDEPEVGLLTAGDITHFLGLKDVDRAVWQDGATGLGATDPMKELGEGSESSPTTSGGYGFTDTAGVITSTAKTTIDERAEGTKADFVHYVKVDGKQIGTDISKIVLKSNGVATDTYTAEKTGWIKNTGSDCYMKTGVYFAEKIGGTWYRLADEFALTIDIDYKDGTVVTGKDLVTVDMSGVDDLSLKPEVFTETPVQENKDDQTSGGNWYDGFTATVGASTATINSTFKNGDVVTKTGNNTLFDALDTINGKNYPTGEGTEVGVTRNLGMSIPVTADKGITHVSGTVSVDGAAAKSASLYAAPGLSTTDAVVTLTKSGDKAPLESNTHMVVYPLIAEKITTDSWKIGGPANYVWTYTYYNVSDEVVGTQTLTVNVNYKQPSTPPVTPPAPPTNPSNGTSGGGSSSGSSNTSTGAGSNTDPVVTPPADGTTGSTDVTYDNVTTSETMVQGDKTITTAEITLDTTVTDAATTANPVSIKTELSTSDTVASIENAATSAVEVKLVVPNAVLTNANVTLSEIKVDAAVFEAAKASGKDVTFTVETANGTAIATWTFSGAQIANAVTTDLAVNMRAASTNLVAAANNGTVVSFNHSGALPSKASVSLNVDGKYNNGDKLFLYYVNTSTGALDFVSANNAVANGKVTIAIDHCSEYILTKTAITTATPGTPATKPPQTGDTAPISAVVVLAVMAGALVLGKKKLFNN